MLEAACREQDLTRESWGDLSQAQQGTLAERIIVDEEHKLLFCPVPLTAIGPWMKVLYYLGPGRELKSLDQVPSNELSNRRTSATSAATHRGIRKLWWYRTSSLW